MAISRHQENRHPRKHAPRMWEPMYNKTAYQLVWSISRKWEISHSMMITFLSAPRDTETDTRLYGTCTDAPKRSTRWSRVDAFLPRQAYAKKGGGSKLPTTYCTQANGEVYVRGLSTTRLTVSRYQQGQSIDGKRRGFQVPTRKLENVCWLLLADCSQSYICNFFQRNVVSKI